MRIWKKLWQETKWQERVAISISVIALIIASGWSLSRQSASETLPPIFEDVPATASQQSTTSRSARLSETGTITIHVAGAVKRPGVLNLPGNARVVDAIKAAGGAGKGADVSSLNLAAYVEDGSQIRVPTRGEAAVSLQPKASGSAVATQQSGAGQSTSTPPKLPKSSINVNTASASELEILPGIGPALASRIISYREENGRFNTIDDLDNVKGIGPAKLEKMRPFVTF